MKPADQKAAAKDHNARIKAFTERPDLAKMSQREYADAYAEAMRISNIELREGMESFGWISPRDERFAAMRAIFEDFNIDSVPQSGWDRLLDDLDLIFVQIDIPDTTKGNATLLKEVRACIKKLQSLRKTFFEFNHSTDFMVAGMMSNAPVNEHIPHLEALIKSHEVIENWLAERVQPPRWREKVMRNCRLELAIKLLSIFYREFGQLPKPDGGSAHISIERANSWQRFYQACAFIRLGERETPDRQAILWEAHGHW